MIDVAITSLLETVAGVSTRVSPGAETVNVSTGLPRVAYTLLDEDRRYDDDGNARLTLGMYQIDIFADLPTEARAIARSIQADWTDSPPGLDGYQGTVDTTRIERIYFSAGQVQQGIKIDGKQKTLARYFCEMFVEYRG